MDWEFKSSHYKELTLAGPQKSQVPETGAAVGLLWIEGLGAERDELWIDL